MPCDIIRMYVNTRIYISESVTSSNQDALKDPEWFGSHSRHVRRQAYGVLDPLYAETAYAVSA